MAAQLDAASPHADAVAAPIWLLYGRLDRQLAGKRSGTGYAPLTGQPHDEKLFWERAVGVVTPHRYSLNRFNVMASRVRAKLIILLTRSLVDHLADDSEVLEESPRQRPGGLPVAARSASL